MPSAGHLPAGSHLNLHTAASSKAAHNSGRLETHEYTCECDSNECDNEVQVDALALEIGSCNIFTLLPTLMACENKWLAAHQ